MDFFQTGGHCESQQNASVMVCITPPLRVSDLSSSAEVLLLPTHGGDAAADSFNSNYLQDGGLWDIRVLEDPMFEYFGTRFRLKQLVLTLKVVSLKRISVAPNHSWI